MGEAKRRAREIEQQQKGVKMTPRQQAIGRSLVHHKRIEETRDDGMVYAVNFYRVARADGLTDLEETPDGPQPVLLASIPQPVRRAILATPGLVVAR